MFPLVRRQLACLTTLGPAVALIASCAGPAKIAAPTAATAASTLPPPVAAAAPEDVLPDILRASVQIAVEHGGSPFRWGSGVVLGTRPAANGPECLVLTAGHTVHGLAGGDEVFALLDRHRPEAEKVRAQVVVVQDSPSVDLALLSIRNGTCFSASAGQAPSLGTPIWVVGFPYGGELTVARGIVSQISQTKAGGPSGFTIDASTSHGSSGAGVFESRTGRLIGLVEAFGTARVEIKGQAASHIDIPMPGMTYVTPVNRIDDFLRAAGSGPLLIGRQ